MQNNVEEMLNEYKDGFDKFRTILLESNKKFNLTAISDENEVQIKHFYDSVAPERFFKQGARVAEIGSGGGFPSVPLMIVRKDLKFTLIESTGKKCDYLKEVVESLGLHCEQVLNIRAEDGAKDPQLREKFDVVTARAVAKLNTLSEYCLPYVKVGGTFIAYKGDGEDITEAERAISILGGKIEEVYEYELPCGYGKRRVVIIKKVSATPLKYPRGNGKERKNPL
ncbi:MAG: 16S rRNA (guanine(527)-N(7))-methyltransferase RsmG [Clostridia bacterium]|nr:16S rRNA (guanine(527)-N(7))-methyltransferase RsmG [Clostridia bacterium]